MDRIHRKIYVLFFVISLFLSGCVKVWSGVPEFKQKLNFSGDKKSDVIDDLGMPDSTFTKSNSEEYWLYKCSEGYYIVAYGKKRVKGFIIEFNSDTVRSTFTVEPGVVDEIMTRGWKYGIKEVVY